VSGLNDLSPCESRKRHAPSFTWIVQPYCRTFKRRVKKIRGERCRNDPFPSQDLLPNAKDFEYAHVIVLNEEMWSVRERNFPTATEILKLSKVPWCFGVDQSIPVFIDQRFIQDAGTSRSRYGRSIRL